MLLAYKDKYISSQKNDISITLSIYITEIGGKKNKIKLHSNICFTQIVSQQLAAQSRKAWGEFG